MILLVEWTYTLGFVHFMLKKKFRNQGLAGLLIEAVKEDCRTFDIDKLYLATDFADFYEHFDFHYLADGYHPWGEKSRIYEGNIN